MIRDASDVIDFKRDTYGLQEFALFCAITPASTSDMQVPKLNSFLFGTEGKILPFEWIKLLHYRGELGDMMRKHKLGQYKTRERGFQELAYSNIDLRYAHPDDFLAFCGWGMKVARMFVCYTRKECEYAILDTHTLRWLREECGYKSAPRTSPSNPKEYAFYEKAFLAEAQWRGKHPTILDQEVWRKYQRKINGSAMR